MDDVSYVRKDDWRRNTVSRQTEQSSPSDQASINSTTTTTSASLQQQQQQPPDAPVSSAVPMCYVK